MVLSDARQVLTASLTCWQIIFIDYYFFVHVEADFFSARCQRFQVPSQSSRFPEAFPTFLAFVRSFIWKQEESKQQY